MKDDSEINGIYNLAYTGQLGSGFSLFLFRDGVIAGADVGGGTYDGTYEEKESNLHCRIKMTIPPGLRLVMNAPQMDKEYAVEFSLTLTLPVSNEQIRQLQLPIGKVNAILRQIRAI
jgi:hypothetical protein